MRTDNIRFSADTSFPGKEITSQVISEVLPPQGWEIVEDRMDAIAEPQDKAGIKKVVNDCLPKIARNVELFIDRAEKQYDIFIPQAFISIDEDATFRIELLVKQEDLHTPKFLAAKIQADVILTTTDKVSMRHTFVAAGEYFRFHSMQTSSKLKYAYKAPAMLPLALVA